MMGCRNKLRISNFKVCSIFCFSLKLIVFTTTFRLVLSTEFLLQNPGKGVNFYGKIQSKPTPSESSYKNSYEDLLQADCAKAFNESSCNRDKLYHYPGLVCQLDKTIPCNYSNPYRTYDGSCNNPHSSSLGMTNQCYQRFLPAYYEGFDGFRSSVKGGPLPEPREISIKIFKDHHRPSVNVSAEFVFFGEYTFTDFLHTVKPSIDCCSEENVDNPECAPILISSDDPFYSQFNKTCIDFKRAVQCSCETNKRIQENSLSFYMDASQFYGLNEEDVMKIRALDGTGRINHPISIMPSESASADSSCPKKKEVTCFGAIDLRSTAEAVTESHFTLFMREHNRIAMELKHINPHWGDEKLFQEARKIYIAESQCILFRDYLPILLTPRIVEEFGFTVPTDTSGMQYNSSIIPGVWNEFATSSFRLHSMLPKHIGTLNLRIKQIYNNPGRICQSHFTNILKGIRQTPAEEYDRYIITDLTDFLFQQPGVPYGNDLLSITVQRGRDQGLAPYIELVKFCSEGTVIVSSFDDLYTLGLMSEENTDLLKKIYAAVEDIDMVVGMQLENHMPGAVTGPSAVCINAKQFYFVQKADRFYFDLVGPEASFTDDQRKSLKQSSLSRILCDNTNISEITKNVFLMRSNENPIVSCEEIPKVNLTLWKDNGNNANTP